MTGLTSAGRNKLGKALAMLGSDHSGKRDAAGLAAHRLVTTAGLSWSEILDPPPVEHRLPELGTWRATVRECLAHAGDLRPWERTFLTDLPKFRRLSVKQRYVLKEIANRVLRRVAA